MSEPEFRCACGWQGLAAHLTIGGKCPSPGCTVKVRPTVINGGTGQATPTERLARVEVLCSEVEAIVNLLASKPVYSSGQSRVTLESQALVKLATIRGICRGWVP